VRANAKHSSDHCMCYFAVQKVAGLHRRKLIMTVSRPEENGLQEPAAGPACGTNSVRENITGRAMVVPTAHLPPMGLHACPLTMLTISGPRQADPQPFRNVHSEAHSVFVEILSEADRRPVSM